MKNKDIKLNTGEKLDKGFLVLFTAKKNDKDQYTTAWRNVKTKASALVLIEIFKMFNTKKGISRQELGNKDFHNTEDLKSLVVETIKENITDEDVKIALSAYYEVWQELDEDNFYSWLTNKMVDVNLSNELNFCRAIEKVELYEVEKDFVMPDIELPIIKINK